MRESVSFPSQSMIVSSGFSAMRECPEVSPNPRKRLNHSR